MTESPQGPAILFPGIGKHHNLMDVANFLASMSSAQFLIDHFDKARPFPEKSQIYSWALKQSDRDGLVLEFGVASGGTVNLLATHHKGPVYGFDVFTGLPETWRPGFPKGAFAQATLPKVRENVKLVVGLFEDTLPGFVLIHPDRIKLLHVDCDIYSGTVTIFDTLSAQIDDNTIIIFDEYLNYPGWEKCEHKAFIEFCARTGREPEYLAFVPGSEQVVARAVIRQSAVVAASGADVAPPPLATPAVVIPSSVRPGTHQHVRHITLDALSAAGYAVERIEDGATALDPVPGKVPDNWNHPQQVIVPQVATLKNGTLFQDGSVLLPDGHYCYYDATFNLEPWRERHNRSVMRFIDPDSDDALIRPHARSMTVTGRCFSTLSNTTHNYGHFIHDVLSRIYYEDLGVIAPGRETVIAPQFKFPMQKILFEMVFKGYQIVQAPAGTALEVEDLVLPTNLCSSLRFNPKGIAGLAARMRRLMAPYASTERHKVCVSRRDGKDSGGRAFVNMEAFETGMQAHGYRVVEVSALDPKAQFDLWANTTAIAGVHGAGLMNMILMQPGRYTEIGAAPRGPNYTARCAMAAGHGVSGMAGEINRDGHPVIDLDRLYRLLDKAA